MKYSCHQNTYQTNGFDSPGMVLVRARCSFLCCDLYFVLDVPRILMSSVINTTSILRDGLMCTDLPVGPLVLGHTGVCRRILRGLWRLQGQELVLQFFVLLPHLFQLLQPRAVLPLLLLTQVLNHSLLRGKGITRRRKKNNRRRWQNLVKNRSNSCIDDNFMCFLKS